MNRPALLMRGARGTGAAHARGGGTATRAGGFSLVEMLVAIAVFGLIAAAGVGVLAHAVDNRDAVAARMNRIAEFQRARAILRADLGQAALRRVRTADGTPARNAFAGANPGMRGNGPLLGFVRRGWDNPDSAPRPSLQYVEYRFVDDRLERSVRLALDGAAPGEPQLLLSGVRSARMAYRYRGQWNEGWPGGAGALPEAVALILEIDGLGQVEQRFLLPGAGA
jgi:general secretion pathway protein J